MDTELHVEIYPDQRKAEILGTYRLANERAVPIDFVHLATASGVETGAVAFGRPATRVLVDSLPSEIEPYSEVDPATGYGDLSNMARGVTLPGCCRAFQTTPHVQMGNGPIQVHAAALDTLEAGAAVEDL